jgi:RNA polymerase sigma-70 factor (ECF subfamily)
VNELGASFADVLSRASTGDREAFAELWRATHPGLVRYLRVVCGPDDADDVASEAWVKVIRGLGTFSGDEPAFRGWVAVIARNHARDLGRRSARRPEQLAPAPEEHGAGVAEDTADVALERLSTDDALRLVAALPAGVAEMVALRVVVGLDVAEVARIVGKTPGAVRVAVHRGLRALAAQLGADTSTGPV